MLNSRVKSDLELMVHNDERILWRGRPDKKCYILEAIVNPLLFFSGLWLLFDLALFGWIGGTRQQSLEVGTIIFLAIHLMPVWIYLINALFVFRRYHHTEYIITDKGVYVSGGTFAYTCQMKPYTEVSHISIHRGIFDQQLGVGDVVFSSQDAPVNTRQSVDILSITDIRDYQKVFELVKKLQTDIFADTMYPNDLRPAENHGYRTKYKGL